METKRLICTSASLFTAVCITTALALGAGFDKGGLAVTRKGQTAKGDINLRNMQTFTAPDGAFSVDFPCEPNDQRPLSFEKEFPSDDGKSYGSINYTVEGKRCTCFVTILRLSGKRPSADEYERFCDFVYEKSKEGMGGQLVVDSRREIPSIIKGSYRGKEVKGTYAGAGFKIRSYLVGNVVYILTA